MAALLLFFVFFLPLHLHVGAAPAQINKECSCAHGSRTQLALAPEPLELVPAHPVSRLPLWEPEAPTACVVRHSTIRAPPRLLPL